MKKLKKHPDLDQDITNFRLEVNSNLLSKKSPLVLQQKASDEFMKYAISPWRYMLERITEDMLASIEKIIKR